MYDYWVAIIIGIVEGLTEFLPVSSTGHMILTQALLGISEDDNMMKTFNIVIQLGAILAVVIVYWSRILNLFGIRVGVQKHKQKRMNLLHILAGIVPVMLLALIFDNLIETYLFSKYTVIIGLVLGGILLIVAENKKHTKPLIEDIDDLSYKQAFQVGLWQIVSLWPGFSRSGSTIAGGMLGGVSRKASADFTFIMAIPIMFAATGYSLLKSWKLFDASWIGFFTVGFVVSFIVALLAVVTFIKLVGRMKLTYFAYYRFALAAFFLIYLIVTK
ncbi:undecaprenyl-diphosphate phosphatase [Paenibacillus sp. N1-5-1-14]|uniref:undecaprenyl-diphosphate phosphatase n=1 Tax=Paenibacillus radicibacter TaxID=2972488 RepID=UPI0021595F69|nr:undecaprenyl-diphosphate phosphatase [Paenibacillus radicibacter]MCR8643679.1 undecaprenyl-diphosphate phosphatase [Paenibacillus radicibacter]